MADPGSRFSCESCGRSFVWKPEIAGKHVKCKCGNVLTIPDAVAEPEPDENALYDLAESEEEATKSSPSLHRVVEAPQPSPPSQRAVAVPYRGVPALGERQRDRFSASNLMDMQRDVYVPTGLLLLGLMLYVAYYAFRFHLGGGGIIAITLGLGVMTAFKAGLLVGFALLIAGPLGVSFGGLWTTALKLAAIAVFTDGTTTIVDGFVQKLAGGSVVGFSGYSAISLPIAIGIYWTLLIYLFSMDPGDSWTVVIVLSVFDYIVRTALMLLLLQAVLGFGGLSSSAMGTLANAKSATASPLDTRIDELKERNLLIPAQKVFDSGRQDVAKDSVAAWTAAGAKNVWYEISRDFSGKTEPMSIVIEMPDDPTARAKCYSILKDFYDKLQNPASPQELVDDHEPYLAVRIH